MNNFNILRYTGNEITPQTFAEAEILLRQNFKAEISKEFFQMLWRTVKAEGWTQEEFTLRFTNFLKTQKFPNFTVADFFNEKLNDKIYSNYQTYLKWKNDGVTDNEIESISINQVGFFRKKDN